MEVKITEEEKIIKNWNKKQSYIDDHKTSLAFMSMNNSTLYSVWDLKRKERGKSVNNFS